MVFVFSDCVDVVCSSGSCFGFWIFGFGCERHASVQREVKDSRAPKECGFLAGLLNIPNMQAVELRGGLLRLGLGTGRILCDSKSVRKPRGKVLFSTVA